MSASERKEGIMNKLATIRVLIAVAVVATLGIGVRAAGAKPVDSDCSDVPQVLCSPTKQSLPNEQPAINFSAPSYAQFIRIQGTNRYRVKSIHGGLDD